MKLATTLILAMTLATLTIHAAPVDTAAEAVEKREYNWTGTPSKPEPKDSYWKKRETGTPSKPESKDSHWKKRGDAEEVKVSGWGQDWPDSSTPAKPDDGVWL